MLKTRMERLNDEFRRYANSKCCEIEKNRLFVPSDKPSNYSVSSFGMQSPAYVESINEQIV